MKVIRWLVQPLVWLIVQLVIGATQLVSFWVMMRRYLRRRSPWLPWAIAILVSIGARLSAVQQPLFRPRAQEGLLTLSAVIVAAILLCLLLAFRSFRQNWLPTELLNRLQDLSDDVLP